MTRLPQPLFPHIPRARWVAEERLSLLVTPPLLPIVGWLAPLVSALRPDRTLLPVREHYLLLVKIAITSLRLTELPLDRPTSLTKRPRSPIIPPQSIHTAHVSDSSGNALFAPHLPRHRHALLKQTTRRRIVPLAIGHFP